MSRIEHFGHWAVRGAALTYLVVLLVIPLAVIASDGLRAGLEGLWREVTRPVAVSAIGLTLWTAGVMAVINSGMGLLTAYVLTRYTFPGQRALDALVDVPLAMPTLVTGVMLVALYGPQTALGGWLGQTLGWQVVFAPPGIVLALLFITFPVTVRMVQPVLEALDRAPEEAAATLGANGWVIFWRVTFPALAGPVLSAFLLSVARALGEFGSIVVVAGNIPFRSQTAAVYVWGLVESDNRLGASAVSLVIFALAFGLVLMVDALQRRREGG